MTDCIFCKIIKKEIPSNIIYEDQNTLAFLDITPINKGHTLVIPKKHYENIYDVPEDILKEITSTTKKVAKAIKSSLNPAGINITQNNEKAAGQDIFHIHFHIIPRYQKDGYQLWKGKKYEEGEAKEISSKIKNSL